MPEIQHQYTAHDGNYSPGGNSCDWIVVHNTGNTASAEQEAQYASNDQHESSYHYVLDGDEIYQLLDDGDTAWSVGAWPGCTQYIGNGESISIEVCSNGVPFTSAEIDDLTWLVGVLMDRHGIDADHVVRHRDCHSGHKDCPGAYVDDDAWAALRTTITGGDIMTDEDIDRIAGAVWGYSYQGSAPGGTIYNTLCYAVPGWVNGSTNSMLGQVNRIVEPHTANPDGDSGKLYTRDQIDRIDAKQTEIEAKLDSILAALGR